MISRIFFLLLLASLASNADELICSIKPDSNHIGTVHGQLTVRVFLEDKRLLMGENEWEITGVTEVFVTAFSANDVGGGVLVLNRNSGEYKLANVGLLPPVNPETGEMLEEPDTISGLFSGICKKRLF